MQLEPLGWLREVLGRLEKRRLVPWGPVGACCGQPWSPLLGLRDSWLELLLRRLRGSWLVVRRRQQRRGSWLVQLVRRQQLGSLLEVQLQRQQLGTWLVGQQQLELELSPLSLSLWH